MTTVNDDTHIQTVLSLPPGFDAIDPVDSSDEQDHNSEFVFMDYEYDYESVPSLASESYTKNARGVKRVSTASKTGLHRIRREVPPKLREAMGRHFIHVSVYETSSTPDRRIRNAITGLYTPYRVGTYAENMYFKVSWAMGTDGRKDPVNLFFETPAEFEKHFLETLSDDVKRGWTRRCRETERYYQAGSSPAKKQEINMDAVVSNLQAMVV